MQRHLLLLLLVACTGLICISALESPRNSDDSFELEFGGRKLMQAKNKTKAGKAPKQDLAPKKQGGDGKKSFSSDGSQEVVVPKGGKLKEKRALDEEDDDDIRFMEEEKSLEAQKQVDSGKNEVKPKKKSKPVKKPVKKTEDPIEVEHLEDAEAKKDPAPAVVKKDKRPKPKSSKKAKLDEDLVVEKITDDDHSEAQKVKDKAKSLRKPVADMEIEKIEDEEGESTKKSFGDEGEEIMPVNIDEEELNQELVEDDRKEEPEIKPEKKPKQQMPKKDIDGEPEFKPEMKPKQQMPKKGIDEEPEFKPEKKPKQQLPKKGIDEEPEMKMPEQKKPKKKDPEIKPKPTPKTSNSTKKAVDLKKKKPEPVTKEQLPGSFPDRGTAVEDVEDLQVGALLQESEDEEEDLNFVDEVSKLPTKFQETAGQVKETLLPRIQKLSETSKTYFTSANQQMTQRFTPIMGEQVAPVVASLISYALLLVPLMFVLYMLERIRASLSLAKVLFFINLYLGAYFVTLVLATFALHSEPMAFLFRNSRSSCVFLQLLQALGFVLYFVLYTVVFFKSCSLGGFVEKLAAGFQWVIVALFGLHYYVTVFHKVMAMKVPRSSWRVYLVYSAAFAVLAMFARAKIEPAKKEYYYSPVDDSEEAIPIDKRS